MNRNKKTSAQVEAKCDFCHYIGARLALKQVPMAQMGDCKQLCLQHAGVHAWLLERDLLHKLGLISNGEYERNVTFCAELAILITAIKGGAEERPAA